MTIPIWVTDPTGNNNPFLKIVSKLYVAIGNVDGTFVSWKVSLFGNSGNVFWTVTVSPDAMGTALNGAVVDSLGNAWGCWATGSGNILIKFANVDGTQTSYTSSDLNALLFITASPTNVGQMAIDGSDNISVCGTKGASNVRTAQVLTFDNNGNQTFASGQLPAAPTPGKVLGTCGIAATKDGIVTIGLLSQGYYEAPLVVATDSSNIMAVEGASWNQKWGAPTSGFGQELQVVSSDGLGRTVGQLFTFTGTGVTQQGSSFVFAYTNGGGQAWQTSIKGSAWQSIAEAIDGDPTGNVYISFKSAANSSLSFGNYSIIKFDSSGGQVFTTTDGDAASSVAFMAATPTGVIGSANNASYSLWDGITGNVTWTNTLSGVAQLQGIGRQV